MTAPKLRTGERVRIAEGGPVYRVELVNDCRARLVCEGKRHQVVRDRVTGDTVAEFDVPATGPLDVSPRSIVERVS